MAASGLHHVARAPGKNPEVSARLMFWALPLRMMQDTWYRSDDRRERFVTLGRDVDVKRLTFMAYVNKKLVRAKPLAHLRILSKNIAHLTRLIPAA